MAGQLIDLSNIWVNQRVHGSEQIIGGNQLFITAPWGPVGFGPATSLISPMRLSSGLVHAFLCVSLVKPHSSETNSVRIAIFEEIDVVEFGRICNRDAKN